MTKLESIIEAHTNGNYGINIWHPAVISCFKSGTISLTWHNHDILNCVNIDYYEYADIMDEALIKANIEEVKFGEFETLYRIAW